MTAVTLVVSSNIQFEAAAYKDCSLLPSHKLQPCYMRHCLNTKLEKVVARQRQPCFPGFSGGAFLQIGATRKGGWLSRLLWGKSRHWTKKRFSRSLSRFRGRTAEAKKERRRKHIAWLQSSKEVLETGEKKAAK